MGANKKRRGLGARYEPASVLVNLALEFMAARQGLSVMEIQDRLNISRSTAFRMMLALGDLPGVEVKSADKIDADHHRTKRWRARIPDRLAFLAMPTAEEISALHRAKEALAREGLSDEVTALERLTKKVEALMPDAARRIELDVEDQLRVRGLLTRPGPRLDADIETIQALDKAFSYFRQIEVLYQSGASKKPSRRTLCPFGILTGRWAYLIAFDPEFAGKAIATERLKTYRIDRIQSLELLSATYERPNSPTLAEYAQRSFGVYQKELHDVVWRFSPEVADEAERFQFHRTQSQEREEDGSLIVRFRAGGLMEMVQHLFTWRDQVEVIAPDALRVCWAEELAESAKALGRSRQATTASRDRK